MDESYALTYQRLYREHWWWRARERLLLDTLDNVRPSQGWPNILDVGCGAGLFFECLSRYGDVEGVEPDARIVTGPHQDRIHAGPFDETFRPHKRYDLILMLDVLEHLPHAEQALSLARSLMNEKGLLVLTVPAFESAWTQHDDLNHHLVRYTRRSLRQVAAEAGIEVVQDRYFFNWLYPVKLLVRLAEAVLPLRPRTPGVPARWLNQALYGLSRAEMTLTRGLPIPVGSSLLAICRAKRQVRPSEPAVEG